MRLGEILVKEGLITREHLKLALDRQVIFGGRIGTNIVELGILTEDEFTKFLSNHLKLPMVESSKLTNIDEETIKAISKEMAEKYKAIPFKKDKNRLHVAMLDPKNVSFVDEFRFVSGFDIIPHVASELRILYALEKYYNVKRDLRYISIFDRFEEDKQITPSDSEELTRMKDAFANVKEKEDIAGLLISEAQKIAKRIGLFVIKGNAISGWKSKGLNLEGFDINLAIPSIFNDVLSRKAYYRGPILKIPGNDELIKITSGTPQDCVAIPISIRERTIAVLYADNGNDAVLDANINYLHKLTAIASLAFELLILRKKIMDM